MKYHSDAQRATIMHDVVTGDQAWRLTVAQRYAAYRRAEAEGRMASVQKMDEELKRTAPTPEFMDQRNGLDDNARQSMAMVGLLERGEVKLSDPEGVELMLRLQDVEPDQEN